jgi:hypothetical protein
MDRYEDSMFDELGFEEGDVGFDEFDERRRGRRVR